LFPYYDFIHVHAYTIYILISYIEWSQHEVSHGQYNFSGELDFEHYIKLAQEEGLYVILRPGPYICAERDFVSNTIFYTYDGD
jgi:beta-galactosidase GanA